MRLVLNTQNERTKYGLKEEYSYSEKWVMSI
ncbi:MAG: hypothetical protein ACJAVN_000043 [Roseivirga sp.]|jgi:hypothetical protein